MMRTNDPRFDVYLENGDGTVRYNIDYLDRLHDADLRARGLRSTRDYGGTDDSFFVIKEDDEPGLDYVTGAHQNTNPVRFEPETGRWFVTDRYDINPL